MGYSCTQDASYMLGVISHFYATDGNPNILTIRDKQYFFERGREQGDGAITGTLMRMVGDYAYKSGRVRIEPDGTISSFPMPAVDKEECTSDFQDMSARNPQLLRQWSIGRL